MPGAAPAVELRPTESLTADDLAAIRALMDLGWPDPDEAFQDEDWDHALGGVHAYVRDAAGRIVAHGSVVPRTLWIGTDPVATGYVEAVATHPGHRRLGLGSAVMEALDGVIAERYALGCLGTGEDRFYARLGWERWRGSLWVRRAGGGRERCPDEEGYVWVLRTPASPSFTGDEPLSCEERSGDDW
jgi:aminoglycoside 2'-N-acetyltransferase I